MWGCSKVNITTEIKTTQSTSTYLPPYQGLLLLRQLGHPNILTTQHKVSEPPHPGTPFHSFYCNPNKHSSPPHILSLCCLHLLLRVHHYSHLPSHNKCTFPHPNILSYPHINPINLTHYLPSLNPLSTIKHHSISTALHTSLTAKRQSKIRLIQHQGNSGSLRNWVRKRMTVRIHQLFILARAATHPPSPSFPHLLHPPWRHGRPQ